MSFEAYLLDEDSKEKKPQWCLFALLSVMTIFHSKLLTEFETQTKYTESCVTSAHSKTIKKI